MSLIEICFSADANYAPYMGVGIYSILRNSAREDKFRFYILDGGIRSETKEEIASLKKIKAFEINYYRVNKDRFKGLKTAQDYISLATFYRFLIPEIFPESDRILYLDSDLMVLNSISGLFDSDLEGYACAGVADSIVSSKHKEKILGPFLKEKYINAGVLLINCQYWRRHNAIEALFNYVIKEKPLFNDQDAINYIFRGKIKIFPYQFNVMTGDFIQFGRIMDKSGIIIRHFSDKDKPWLADGFQPMTDIFREYMLSSPWRDRLPPSNGGFIYWFQRFLKYWFIHPVFFLKPKFYRQCFNMGLKAGLR